MHVSTSNSVHTPSFAQQRVSSHSALSRQSLRAPSLLFCAFAILFICGVYTDIPTSRNGIPMISAFPFAVIGFLYFLRRINSVAFLGAIGVAIFVYFISIPATETLEYFPARSLAFGQYVYSVIIGVTLYWTVTSFSAHAVEKFLRTAITVIIVLMAVEIFTPFSEFLDKTMNPLYGLTDFGDIIRNRDLSIGGGLRRPKLFTSETSYLALSYTLMVCAYAQLSRARGSTVRALLFAVVGLVLIRSPIVAFAAVFVGCLIYSGRGKPGGLTTTERRLLLTAFSAPVALTAAFLLTQLFTARFQQITSGADYSVTYRTYGSLLAALATVREHPLVGVGIGSIDAAYEPLTQTYLRLGVPASSVFYEWRFQVQNLPSALLIYLGLGGGLAYLFLMHAYARRLVGRLDWKIWSLLILQAATISAFYSPRFNVYFFLILAINFISRRDTHPLAAS